MRYLMFFLTFFFSGPILAAPIPPNPPAVVFVRPATLTELYDQLSYPARVVSKVNTSILAESDGVISQIFAPLGKRVSKRERLLMIRHTDPVYQYAPLVVSAPVGGVVSFLEVSEGTQVTRGQKLASITDPKKIRITVEVPASDLSVIRAGLMGDYKSSGSEQSLAVRVHGVSPYVDPASGTASAELELDAQNTGAVLPPGSLGQVSFKVNQRSGFQVVDSAVIYKGKDTFVRVLDEGKSIQKSVKLGKKFRGNVEILTGLTQNAKIIERSSRYVADGEAVQVEEEKK